MNKKKKRVIIPIVAILLTLCAIAAVTLFTTPLAYIIHSSIYTYDDGETEIPDYFDFASKWGRAMENSYKLHPTLYNLDIVADTYNIHAYIEGTYHGQQPPKDYLEKSVKYLKLRHEYAYTGQETLYAIPVGVNNETYWKIWTTFDYAVALYVSGNTEEMKKVCEETIKLIDAENYIKANSFKDVFYLILADSKDESLRNWALEKEAYFDNFFKENGKFEEFYKHYDSWFTNPDYDKYINDKWPEYAENYFYWNNQ